MLPIEFRFSINHLLVSLYLVTLVLLVLLLKWEKDKEVPEFSLFSNTIMFEADQVKLSVTGENFHDDINALAASSLVGDEAILWRLLENIPVTEIAVRDDLLLVASSERGKVLSISAKKDRAPRFLGSIQLPEAISKISIVGDKALAYLQRHHGVAVLDIQDPANIHLLEIINETGLVTDLVASGSQVFHADIYKGVGRIDVLEDGSRVQTMAQVDSPWRISKTGDKLAVGTLKDKVYLYDVVNGGNLREVGNMEFPINIRGVAMMEKSLCVALADGSLHIYELGRWPALKKAAQMSLPGAPLDLTRVEGTTKIVVSIVSGGLAIVDLQAPSSPVLKSHLKEARTFRGLAVKSDTIYGGSRLGMLAYSVKSIEKNRFGPLVADALVSKDYSRLKNWNGMIVAYTKGTITRLAAAKHKTVVESRYLAVNDKDQVSLFQMKKDGRFEKIGGLIEPSVVKDAMVLGDYLYVLYPGGMKVSYCHAPDSIQIVADLQLPGSMRELVPLDDKTMLVASRDNGVHFVNITSPTNPQLITTVVPERHLQTVNITYDLIVDGKRVYVSYGSGGVYVLDVSQPEAPTILQKIETRSYAKQMEMVDGVLLVEDGLYGLFMIDTKTYDVAVPIGTLQVPSRVDSMAVADDALFVSSYPGGTMKLPPPSSVVELETVGDEKVTFSLDLLAGRQLVYLYDNRSSSAVKVTSEARINQNL